MAKIDLEQLKTKSGSFHQNKIEPTAILIILISSVNWRYVNNDQCRVLLIVVAHRLSSLLNGKAVPYGRALCNFLAG